MAIFAEINGERIELVGAAEEATMKKILDAIQSQGSGGGTGGSGGSGGGAGGAAAGLIKMGKSLNLVNVGFNVLGRVVGGVVKGFTALAGAGSAAVKFSTALIDTQPTVKDLATGFKTITGDLLGLGSAIEAVVGLLQKNYNTFQQLSASGIMFGDRMTSLTRLGTSMGTSLQFASGELAKNAERLAYMGTATRGAALAAEAGAEMSAKFADDLLRFGMGFEEQNERFMDFFAQNTLALQKGTMSMQYLIDNSDDYAKSLRRISEITGKSAEEQEEQVRRLRQNKMFENYLATLPEGAKLAAEQLIRAASAGGADMVDVAQAALLGVQPLTEGAQNLSALMPGLSTTFGNLANQANNFNGDLSNFTKSMEDQLRGFANSNRGFVDANSKFFSVLGMYGDPYAEAGSSIAMFVNSFSKSQGTAAGKTDKLAEAFIQLELMMKKVRGVFDDVFIKILGSDVVQKALSALADILPVMADEFSKFMLGITEDIKQKGFFGWLKSVWTELMLDLRLAINDKLGIAVSNEGLRRDLREKYKDSSLDELKTAVAEQTTESGKKYVQEILDEKLKENAQQITSYLREDKKAVLKYLREGDMIGGFWGKKGVRYDYNSNTYKLDEGYKPKEGQLSAEDLLKFVDRLNKAQAYLPYTSGMSELQYEVNPLENPAILKKAFEDYEVVPKWRSIGTKGATGLTKEPEDTLAYIHKNERVLSASENNEYNRRMANNGLDKNHEDTVKLINGVNMLIAEVKKGTEINKRTYDVIVANA